MQSEWQIFNAESETRVVVTSNLPGDEWLERLKNQNYRVDVYRGDAVISRDSLVQALQDDTHAVLGQLTESWDEDLLTQLAEAGGKVYCNYAVGFDNVDTDAATATKIAVGNTPGVLTETTAELAVALTFAAARRITEADEFMRAGKFQGWRPNLFLGELLHGKTLGIIGAGRIGSAYARMMARGHEMNLLYFNRSRNESLENEINAYGEYLASHGRESVCCRKVQSLDELLSGADVLSIHVSLNEDSRHLIGTPDLERMKPNAVLVNTSRGPVIDEEALVNHCQSNPEFKVGLDVFEDEPDMKPGLSDLPNVVLAPHIGSATGWTRENMSKLAALNIIGVLNDYPLWEESDINPFLTDHPPEAIPSLVNPESIKT
jgi:hydroxypyruvate reductase 1